MPGSAPVNTTGAVEAPGHIDWLAGWLTVGAGLTVMVKLIVEPVHVVPPLV